MGTQVGDTVCGQCGKPNPVWSAENDLFNEVNGSPDGIMCPACFGVMAKEKGIEVYFRATKYLSKEERISELEDKVDRIIGFLNL